MKMTKLLKENLEEKINAALRERKEKQEAAYKARVRATEKEIKDFLKEVVNPGIQKILQQNDMDTTINHYGSCEPAPEAILTMYETRIQNVKEYEHLKELYEAQKKESDKRLKDFYIECDLGCDRETYEKALHDLCTFED